MTDDGSATSPAPLARAQNRTAPSASAHHSTAPSASAHHSTAPSASAHPRTAPSAGAHPRTAPAAGPAAAADPGAKPRDATPAAPPSARALPRPSNLRQAPALGRISMVLFVVGAIAIILDVVLYASGVRHLPVWFHLLWLLLPIGLLLGLLNAYVQARRARH